MRALILKKPRQVEVEEVPDPTIEQPTDAILKLTTSAICGSDMHMYEGRTPMDKVGSALGHEPMGIIEEVGDGVLTLKKGDRVVLPFNVSCGFCKNCLMGYYSACLTVNPEKPGGAWGYSTMGPYQGAQAEYLRVPFADFQALKLPGEPFDEFEDDFVLLADIFPTAWHALELAMFQPGFNVTVYGAGPVGLLTLHSAIVRGSGMVYVVDCLDDRLEVVTNVGGLPINFKDGSSVDQIRESLSANPLLQQVKRPQWDDKLIQMPCGVDAVGYEAKDENDPTKDNHAQVINNLIELLDYAGHIGSIGVYLPEDPGGINALAKKGIYEIPYGLLWDKGLTLGTGQTPVKKYHMFLRDIILAGHAKPSFIISHHISIDEAPDFYESFDTKEPGYIKGVIQFK